ncbi:hypothetical protein Pcinc_028921 [Petrolisthes cinctipes]|uniref:Uncharacterized protein n=1 Tax=Petrolisthes cinctipes TaxID=88211 RepID=A0AAE1F231_PETCI|nr:hypothetical protein Pcinc_028921 [Petrolisthes cinctipes]
MLPQVPKDRHVPWLAAAVCHSTASAHALDTPSPRPHHALATPSQHPNHNLGPQSPPTNQPTNQPTTSTSVSMWVLTALRGTPPQVVYMARGRRCG